MTSSRRPCCRPPSSAATRCPGGSSARRTTTCTRRISRHDLDEIHDAAVKAAIKDQEVGGRRHRHRRRAAARQHDRLLRRAPARRADRSRARSASTTTSTTASSASKLPTGSLGLVEEVRFLRRFTERRGQGLGHRARTRWSSASGTSTTRPRRPSRSTSPACMNLELRELVTRGRHRPADRRAVLLGLPRGSAVGDRARSTRWSTAWTRTITLHICYGNRYGKPSWEGSYRYLFPAILEAQVHQRLARVRAARRRGPAAVQGIRRAVHARARRHRRQDATTSRSPALVAERIRRALEIVPAERLVVNPDCGLLHLPRDVAFAKLCAMVEGTRLVRQGAAAGDAIRLADALAGARRVLLRRRARRVGAAARGAAPRGRRRGWRRVPDVVAGSITSYAGGAHGPRPAARRHRGAGARAHAERPPDVRQRRPRRRFAKTLEDLHALGIENVFALTGDFPKAQAAPGPPRPRIRPRLRAARAPHRRDAPGGHALSRRRRRLAVQVRRGGLLYQYLKLEKKIAAGANLAITQVGWDAREVRRAQALSGRARASTRPCSATCTCSARGPPSGWRRASRPAAGSRPRCSRRCARKRRRRTAGCARASSAPRARSRCSAGSAMPARTSAARTMPATSRGSSGASRGAGAAVGGAGRGAPLRRRRRASICTTRRHSRSRRACASRSRAPRAAAASTLTGRLLPVTPRHVAAPPARAAQRVGGRASGRGGGRRARRAGGEAADVRLPGLRQLRARPHGVRVPADLPQADAQRPVRRHPSSGAARSSTSPASG